MSLQIRGDTVSCDQSVYVVILTINEDHGTHTQNEVYWGHLQTSFHFQEVAILGLVF